MIKKLFFIFLGLIAIYFNACSVQDDHLTKGDKLSDQVIAKTGKKLAKKHHMSMGGTGGGGSEQGLTLLLMSFDKNGNPVDISTARRLIVECVQEFLADINNNEQLRPYLKVFPFTPANVEISIIFSDPNGGRVFDPVLEVVAAHGGKVYYRTVDPNDHYKYKSKTDETYEEALAIIKKENE